MAENNDPTIDPITTEVPTTDPAVTDSGTTQDPITEFTSTTEESTSAPQVIDEGVADTTAEPEPQVDPIITPEPVVVPEPVAPVVPDSVAPVVQAATVVEHQVSDFLSKIEEMRTAGTQAQKILIASLDKYITDMAPGKPLDVNVGARNQYNLWKAIIYVVDTAPIEEFKKLWSILLGFFEEYKDKAFHDRYVFRFAEYWLWSEHELNGLHRILNIIKLTSNPNERAHGLKQVDLDRSLAEGFSDDARQKLVNFYKG